MTTPDESGLVYRVVTGDFLVSVEDSDDPDRNPDQHAPTGNVTATPLLPPSGAFRRSRPSDSQLVIPKPIPGHIENGRVVDENGEDGLTLLAEVDGTPVYWSIKVSIKDDEGWTIFQATYNIGEWPEGGVHLPDLVDVEVVPEPELAAIRAAELSAARAEAAAESIQGTLGTIETGRLSEAELNATYAQGSVLPPSRMIDVTLVPLIQDVRVIDRMDGQTWGSGLGRLLTTPDHGHSWTDVCAGPGGVVRGMRKTPDGEVVAYTSTELFKSSGWGTPELSWVSKKTVNGIAQFNTFSFGSSTDGQKMILAEYGPGSGQAWIDSRYAHITTDGGDTWHTRYDADVITGNEPEDSHVHAAGYDEITDRFYVSEGHSVGAGIWHSTDDGLTWARAEGMRCDDPEINTGMDAGPTMIIPTDDGLAVGADDVLGGMYGVPRTADPMDAQLRYLWAWRPNRAGTNGFARNGMRDPETGLAYMCTSSSSPAPVIMAGNAHTAGLVWEWPNWEGNSNDNISAVIIEPGGWIVAYGSEGGVQHSILGRVPSPSVNIPPDTGGLRGGVAQDPTSVAAGVSAYTGASMRATVVGSGSSGQNEDVIIGSGTNGKSIAAGGKVLIGNGVSSEYPTVQVGRSSKSLGSQATLLGNGTESTAHAAQTVTGHGAKGGGTRATVYGASAQATGSESGVFGGSGVASGLRSLALGVNGQALHANSVSLGYSTVTTGPAQVHVGARHMAMLPTTEPPTGAVNGGEGALWVDDAGKLWFKSATQAAIEVQLKEPVQE